jgi:hypothetical protein
VALRHLPAVRGHLGSGDGDHEHDACVTAGAAAREDLILALNPRACATLEAEGPMKNKAIVIAVALVAVFLLGFVPQYIKANRLDSELRRSREAYAGADLRDLIGLAYLQANQKNYGLATETSVRFFSRAAENANQTQDATRRKAIEDLLAPRDRITAELAKGDAAVIGDLQDLFIKTRAATQGAGAP